MPKLHIIYDPTDTIQIGMTPEERAMVRRYGMLHAQMPIAEHLVNRDVYELARKLAELLLEQLG